MEISQGLLAKYVTKKEIWLPTWRGWLLFILFAILVGGLFVRGVYAFLAMNQPIGGQILIVESWLSEKDLKETVRIFGEGGYREIITSGPLLDEDGFLKWRYPDLTSRGEVTRAQLIDVGVPDSLIHVVLRPMVRKDRTYHTARAIKIWLDQQRPSVQLDILSVGPHARRTWLLTQMAFEGAYDLGVIAQPPRDYDPHRWWHSSQGVRTVVGELLAYCYAKFLFFP